ncbi:hypothetical protein SAMN07250955_106239 [Arboricoccus pini]|uniref:Uncharacterized protein n=1 Tax=Arboricoccus pini TaxID=1963835 RepID=A0A212R976_9PROT|nr:DUF6489 family protein [Arboricoccus pini]SNB68769.1 hypothetical protein SAMN07250955_106239 [Arboricoccus pini]
MKFNIEVDCTPEEARQFLGLPDVTPMQTALMQSLQDRLMEYIKTADPKVMMDQWMPMGFKAMEQLPTLWAQMAAASMAGMQPPKSTGKDGRK